MRWGWGALMIVLLCMPVMAAAGSACRQDSLRISSIPVKNMSGLIDEYQPLANVLGQGLGIPVRILHASSYEAVVDALVSGGTDIARLGPASYLQAWKQNPDIEAFATLQQAAGHFSPAGSYYHSLLVTRSDSKLLSLASLRGRRVALGDPASTSGALIPRQLLPGVIGEPLGTYFARQVYTGSHDRALDAVLNGRVDAAFISSTRADEYLARQLIDTDTVQVVWRSQPIHYDPLVFSAGVCEHLKERILNLMTAPTPELEVFLQSQRAVAIVPVDHAAYAPLLPLLSGREGMD